MIKFKMTAAIAALALMAGASAASAQTYGFTQAGQAVTASGQLIQNVDYPGVEQTVCDVQIFGVVAADGQSIQFNSYVGTQAPGDQGNLACGDSLEFPIKVTALNANTINLDKFVVGTRAGPCQEANFEMPYASNVATFPGAFGIGALCSAEGTLTLKTNVGNNPVLIQ